MSNESNKEFARRYMDEIWNKGNLNSELDFVASNVIIHVPPSPGETVSLIYYAQTLRAAMPDLVLTNTLLFGDGDRVVQNWVATGEHRGADLFGVPASGRKLTVSGVNIFRVSDGKISEQWSIIDTAGLMQQLYPN